MCVYDHLVFIAFLAYSDVAFEVGNVKDERNASPYSNKTADRGGGKLRFNTQVKYVLFLLVLTMIYEFSHW